MRRHALNARRRPNQYGISFGKDRRGGKREVDAWVTALLADMARQEVVRSGMLPAPETGA